MSSDHIETLHLVSTLSSKISESSSGARLCAQSIGMALYGLQKLSSDALEVITML